MNLWSVARLSEVNGLVKIREVRYYPADLVLGNPLASGFTK